MGIPVEILTSEGLFTALFSPRGLREIHFPESDGGLPTGDPGGSLTAEQHRWLLQTREALTAVLAGRIPPPLPPLDWTGHSGFRQRVWHALLRIPPGRTASYGEIARGVGKPKSVRAVGGACGANPIPVLVPCHRVLTANGKLGGFSGGLDWKRRLLAREGITPG